MTQAKHTPGPWTWEGDRTHRRFNIRQLGHLIGTSDQARHICIVNNLPDHVAANRDADVAEANARLIAAAPELLEACWEAINALDLAARFCSDDVQDGRPLSIRAQVTHERELIMDAIAKAEGQRA